METIFFEQPWLKMSNMTLVMKGYGLCPKQSLLLDPFNKLNKLNFLKGVAEYFERILASLFI